MIADLKAKAEGFDKKRIYTAVAALVIAGAAGHIMQRSAGDPDGTTVLSASVPGTPTSSEPTEQRVAAATAATMVTPFASPAEQAALAADTMPPPTFTKRAEPQPAMPTPKVRVVADMPGAEDAAAPVLPEQPTSPTEPAPVELASPAMPIEITPAEGPEVTRSANEPILALTEPTVPETTAFQTLAASLPGETAPSEFATVETSSAPAEKAAAPIVACDLVLEAKAEPGALVALTLSAPCDAGEVVEFDHLGLRFSEQLGPEGDLDLLVPALAETANFAVTLAGREEKSVDVTVPDFSAYDRVALMWKGATGLQLHALENGASYGEPGHVWAEAPASPEAASTGDHGFISVLGSTSDGYAADVYTFPTGSAGTGVEPVVSVEAQVMENTCGGEIAGSILRTNADAAPTKYPLTMFVPGCDAVGEYLVLNILPLDLKLAQN